ncbi:MULTISPECIES: cation:proton antiporter subunit C [Alteromonadaceae]|uniref:Cation:proton antiporter subunit C n=1 Tax=Brumicola blandensis TaxID=3075611 RepID=A0AAW8R1A0_9ALTE|nr:MULTISPECIES: cation:proton antiporter subunit C [unclassified Alteromonas]MDT0580933.1 cation:proton antiporter subunit C [Alteromonas sp. W409]MDT0629638.1 cation:proton antiporter subunit C [Alteromonas sp. W364]
MMEYILGHINYWLIVAVMMVGLYTLMSRSNLIKKLAGLAIFQTAVILFYVSLGKVTGGTVPIVDDKYTLYSNPLPQVLMLTAIVVGVATTALGFALVIRIKEAYNSVEESEINEMDEKE